MSTITYDGQLKGATLTNGTNWCFEGTMYDTLADEDIVLQTVGEALAEPAATLVSATSRLVFNHTEVTYTSQVLTAMAAAYANECEGGEWVDAVVKILHEAARRVAVVEALTI